MSYGGREFPCVEYEGILVPEAYDHDPAILPHQHENMEELFPRAFVPHAADADEAVAETDPLEQRGERIGRSGAASPAAPQKTETSTQPLVLCVQVGALTPQATPAACVKLRREALTLQTTPVACVKLQESEGAAPQASRAACATSSGKNKNCLLYTSDAADEAAPLRPSCSPRCSRGSISVPTSSASAA